MINSSLPVLIDFDGVIRLVDRIAPDAEELFSFLKSNHIPFFLLSNSTLRTSDEMLQFLRNNGLKIEVPSMTAVDATLLYVKEKYKRVSVFCRSNIKALFSEFDTDEDPEAVVLGDIDDGWTYERLNEIFRKVFSGADIIAMHKNRYWEPDGKIPIMDAGAFISAIEYATSKTALVIGKPSPIYFNTALRRLGFEPGSKFLMVGDDLESDIAAAQQIGGMGILVYTGKTKYPLNDTMVRPDFEAKNLREVVKILSQL